MAFRLGRCVTRGAVGDMLEREDETEKGGGGGVGKRGTRRNDWDRQAMSFKM